MPAVQRHAPGCTACTPAGNACNGFAIPAVTLELDISYLSLSFNRQYQGPNMYYNISCTETSIIATLPYVGGTANPWLSAVMPLAHFPTRDYYAENYSPDPFDPAYPRWWDSGCGDTGNYQFSVFCQTISPPYGWKLQMLYRLNTGAMRAISTMDLDVAASAQDPLYMKFIAVGKCPISPHFGAFAICPSGEGLPWIKTPPIVTLQ